MAGCRDTPISSHSDIRHRRGGSAHGTDRDWTCKTSFDGGDLRDKAPRTHDLRDLAMINRFLGKAGAAALRQAILEQQCVGNDCDVAEALLSNIELVTFKQGEKLMRARWNG